MSFSSITSFVDFSLCFQMQLVLFLCLLGYVASLRTKGIGQQNSLVGVLGMASGGTSDNSNDMMMPGYDPQKIALQIRYCGG